MNTDEDRVDKWIESAEVKPEQVKILTKESKRLTPEDVDRKFEITARSRRSGNTYTHENAVLFLAKDAAFLCVLPIYKAVCVVMGAGADQLQAIDLLIERVEKYQKDHPDEVKVPDVDPVTEAYVLRP